MAGQQGRRDPKEAALAAARCLNPHPEQVTDPEFLGSDFPRNNADWHQLPGICAMTGTLICDEDSTTRGTSTTAWCSG